MMRKMILLCLVITLFLTTGAVAQNLDGAPYTPGVDADIDMYISNWQDSAPRLSHGSLTERDILTKGDPLNPAKKGAVMKYLNRYVYATLDPGASTQPTTLKGEQEIFYFLSGKGIISAGSNKADLHFGIAVLMPEGLNFTIRNTGDEPLTMYLVSEPTFEGFVPNEEMLVRNENTMPIGGSNWHWTHLGRSIFSKNEGMATLYSVLTIGLDPMTISHPHDHDPGCEEIWTAVRGTSTAFLGKMIRRQPPGTAYNIPPDSATQHCNINSSDDQIKLFYLSVRKDIDGTGL